MKKVIWRKSSLLPISVIILVAGLILACADAEMNDYPESFFAPEITHNTRYAPFFLSFHVLYVNPPGQESSGFNFKYSYISDFNEIDIREWKSYFQNQVQDADLKYILYKARLGEIDTLIFSIKRPGYPVSNELKNNSVLKIVDTRSALDFLYYMGFAKRCEKYATYEREGWYDVNEKDPNDFRGDIAGMTALESGGLKQMANIKSGFVSQRYAFQILRLYYMSKDYDKCIQFHEEQNSLFESNSTSIKYRAMGYLAGAYYAEKKYSNANYLYSIIYDQYDTMKITAYFSFKPQEETDWEQTLAMAKSTREKAVLWQMLGIYADPFRSLKEVYNLNPKSDLLDLLLARTVNVEEEKFLYQDGEFADSKELTDSIAEINSATINQELVDFLKTVADKKNTAKPYEWDLAAGYLCWAKGDNGFSKYLNAAKAESGGDSLVTDQVRLIQLLDKVRYAKAGDKNFEESVVPEFNWLHNSKHAMGFRGETADAVMNAMLIEKYSAIGDKITAVCLEGGLEKNAINNEDFLNKIISFIDKKNKTTFEKYVLSRFSFSKTDILQIEAVKRLYNYKFDEALAILNKDTAAGNQPIYADPFVIHINDCHDCDNADIHKKVYTEKSFIQKMIELQNEDQIDPAHSADIYFQLANGYYNMSYFGNNRALYQTKLTDVDNNYFELLGYGDMSSNNPPALMSCDKAEEYYDKAMAASNDPEFKAKCCFMSAKCEQNIFFYNKPKDYKGDFKAGKYFNMLKSNYSSTQYYREIIQECGYFKTFLKG